MIMNAYLVRKYSHTPAQRRRTTMVLDGQRMGDERDWVLVGFFVTCSSSAEKRFIRPAKQDEMGLCAPRPLRISYPKRHHLRYREQENRTMSEQPGGIQPMAFEENPPAPGEEYEEIREQVRSLSCPFTSRAGWVCSGPWHDGE